jgi:glycosyltransferase involved in cell wall biosynthesis
VTPLRIALVAPGIPESATGPSVSIRELAEQLIEGGHEVTVITGDLAKAGIAPGAMVEIDRRVGLKVFELNTTFRWRLYYSKDMKQWLNANIVRFDVVDIQGVWSFVALHAAAACSRAGIPYVLTLHGQTMRWDWDKRYWSKRFFFSLGSGKYGALQPRFVFCRRARPTIQ